MPEPAQGPLKILIADDEADIRLAIAKHLKRARYTVLEAADGIEALEIAAREYPHLVILDELMPGLTGYEVLRQLRESSELPIPIIVLSVKQSMQYLFEEMNVLACLPKPPDLKLLLEKVMAAIGRPVDAPEPPAEQAPPPPEAAEAEDPNRVTMVGGFGFYSPQMFKERVRPNTVQKIEEKKGQGNVVLLAGSQPTVIGKLSGFLKSQGYAVMTANETQETIKKAVQGNPALILIELSDMPSRFDTNRVYQECKGNDEIRTIPLAAYCYEGVDFEEITQVPMDRILVYSEFDLSDLKQYIRAFFKQFETSGEADEPPA